MANHQLLINQSYIWSALYEAFPNDDGWMDEWTDGWMDRQKQ